LTIAQFCAQECLSQASFSAWKRRLRLIDLADWRPALPAPPAFVPVTVRVVERTAAEAPPIEAGPAFALRRIETGTTNQG
jgi:hypothetical protein